MSNNTDFVNYPFLGLCGKCGNFELILDKDCLCETCKLFGVKRIGPITDEILKFVDLRIKYANNS